MKSFCIIGLGKFGSTLAQTLASEGKQVMVIDYDADKVNAIADTVTNAVIGDPTNEAVLRSCGVADYDCAIVCMTSNIHANILLCIMLKELGVKKVVGRATNEGHEKVLRRVGADMIIFPEKDMGEKIGYLLSRNNVTEYLDFNGYQIVEIRVPKAWIGKDLIKLEARKKYGINIIAITDRNGNANVSPSPTRCFEDGDKVSVIGTDKDIERLVKQID